MDSLFVPDASSPMEVDSRFMPTTVFDMGAHLGEDSEYYLKRGFKVVAFECNPELVDVLRKKFSPAIENGDLRLVEKAIATTAGGVVFYKHANSVWGTVSPDWSQRNSEFLDSEGIEELTVDSVTPEECFEQYGIPYYLKIDVEGMDQEILEALRNFDHLPTYVSIESEKVSWAALRKEFELLATLGYDRFNIVNQRWNRFRTTTWVDEAGERVRYRHRRHSSGPACTDLSRGWRGRRLSLARYGLIFAHYRLLGDSGWLSPLKRIPYAGRFFRYLEAGWYDTHVTRSRA